MPSQACSVRGLVHLNSGAERQYVKILSDLSMVGSSSEGLLAGLGFCPCCARLWEDAGGITTRGGLIRRWRMRTWCTRMFGRPWGKRRRLRSASASSRASRCARQLFIGAPANTFDRYTQQF